MYAQASGSGGFGVVSVGITELLVVLLLVGLIAVGTWKLWTMFHG